MEPQKTAGLVSMMPIFILFVLFYFLLIKPQQKKAKEQKEMINNLSVGDEIVLSSGIIAEIDEIPANKNYIFVRLNDKSIVRVFKDAIIDKYKEENEINNNIHNKNKKHKK